MSTQKAVLEMVRKGATKSDIMSKYNLTPYQYRRMTESFPKTV